MRYQGGERVISCEEVFELRFSHSDWVALQTRQVGLEGTGEIRLRELVKQSLRMRSSRIMGMETRSGEVSRASLSRSGSSGCTDLHAGRAQRRCMLVLSLLLK